MTKRELRRVCVFCGSRPGEHETYLEQASALGTALGRGGVGLVYGGASVGLMGAVADAALLAHGEVIGVLPRSLLQKEIAHAGLHALHVVESMHARKALMAELCDGFIALPGGFGTLDELFEILTWAQLGIHHKPIVLVNWRGFYSALLSFLEYAAEEGFVTRDNLRLLRVCDDAATALQLLRDAPAPTRVGPEPPLLQS
jgi:uncharacterized protein (TIGR00730 family)